MFGNYGKGIIRREASLIVFFSLGASNLTNPEIWINQITKKNHCSFSQFWKYAFLIQSVLSEGSCQISLFDICNFIAVSGGSIS